MKKGGQFNERKGVVKQGTGKGKVAKETKGREREREGSEIN